MRTHSVLVVFVSHRNCCFLHRRSKVIFLLGLKVRYRASKGYHCCTRRTCTHRAGNRQIIYDVRPEVYGILTSEGTKQATKGPDLSEEWRVVEMREGGKGWQCPRYTITGSTPQQPRHSQRLPPSAPPNHTPSDDHRTDPCDMRSIYASWNTIQVRKRVDLCRKDPR